MDDEDRSEEEPALRSLELEEEAVEAVEKGNPQEALVYAVLSLASVVRETVEQDFDDDDDDDGDDEAA